MESFDLLANLNGPAIRCGVHDKSLFRKKFVIEDSIELGKEVLKEIELNKKWLSAVEIAGIISWTTIMMTDIIQDTVKLDPTGRAKTTMFILDMMRDKTSKHKFDQNRYKEEIKKIDVIADALKKTNPKIKDLVNLFSDMAKNTLGLMDFAESAAETKQSLAQSGNNAEKNLRNLLKKLQEIEAKIADDARSDDEGVSRQQSEILSKTTKGATLY